MIEALFYVAVLLFIIPLGLAYGLMLLARVLVDIWNCTAAPALDRRYPDPRSRP